MSNNDYKNITNPTDLGLKSLEEYIKEHSLPFQELNFLNPQTFQVDDSVNLKGDRMRLMQVQDYMGLVKINHKDKKLIIECGLGGIPIDCVEVETFANNRTSEPSSVKFEMQIKRAGSNKIRLATFDSEKIYDVKEFRKETNCLCRFNINEILAFIKQETEKTTKYVEEYQNTGKFDLNNNNWLWGNAALIEGKLYNEIDSYRNIKIDNNKYIRAQKKVRRNIPVYFTSDKPISSVLVDLFENINIAWNGAIEPYLAICFIALSAFYNRFWINEGFGTVGFIGETEGGKTEICNLACGIYGADKSFFSSARSTNVGIEQVLNSYNCIPCVIDDISRYRLTGDNFIDMLKQISIGGQKDKGKNGQESGALPPCSPLVFTSNVMPSEKPEIFNRMLFLNADNLTFSPDNFKYFGRSREELSCILPYILRYSPDEIKNKHEGIKKQLKSQYVNGSDRMLSQIAIALTGYQILSEIANTQLAFPHNKLNQYVMDCISRFKSYKNPIEKLLDAFPILIWNSNITYGNQYFVSKDDDKIILKFHKVAVFKAYNKYFVEDKSEEINTSTVKPVKSPLYEILKFNQSVNINDYRGHGIILDITKHPYAEAILAGKYPVC